jgi:hypothetical protein
VYKVIELFGYETAKSDINWKDVVINQICPYTTSRCYKVRKSQPTISIGTCTVRYGTENNPVIICPNRLLQDRKVFLDCLHLLSLHEPGNDLHVVPEISVPGGSIDYIVASVKSNKVKDFVGIEFQTLDTTGTVWPERQKFLKDKGIVSDEKIDDKSYGMNWKMTAKTTLIQLHHKLETFEYLRKHLVLVVQDVFMEYMKKEFNFNGINSPALIGDSLHFHPYSLEENKYLSLKLGNRLSTDCEGMAKCLGLQAEAKVELETIIQMIEQKISKTTLLKI